MWRKGKQIDKCVHAYTDLDRKKMFSKHLMTRDEKQVFYDNQGCKIHQLAINKYPEVDEVKPVSKTVLLFLCYSRKSLRYCLSLGTEPKTGTKPI